MTAPQRVRSTSIGVVLLRGTVALITALLTLPLVYLVVRASEGGWSTVVDTVWRPTTAALLRRSLLLGAVTTGLAAVIGVAAAWLVARSDLPGRRIFQVAFALPLALPSYIAAWAWIAQEPALEGLRGASLVLATSTYPYVYLPVLAALRLSDPAVEDVARSLGRGPWAVFRTVTLRQVRIAAVGGALLVALYAMSDFGAVSIMRYSTLTESIFNAYRGSFDRTPATIIGCLTVLITLIPMVGAMWLQRESRGRTAKVGLGAPRPTTTVRLGLWRWPVAACSAGFIGVVLGVPAANLVRWNREGTSSTDLSAVWQATSSTLQLAALTAVAALAVAIPIGVLSARHEGRLSRAATAVAYAGHALPGIVVALSLVFFGVRWAYPIYQRTPMLVAAYVVLFLSLAIAAVHQAVSQAPPILDEVARTLGRSPAAAWVTVTARLATPGLGAGATMVFLTVMKELPATLLLRPIGTNTLATRLWTYTDVASYAAAAPYAAALVGLAVLPAAVLTGFQLRGDRR